MSKFLGFSSSTKPFLTLTLLGRILSLFSQYWFLGLQAFLAILAIDVCEVANPKILQLLIDQAIPQKNVWLLGLLAFLLFVTPAVMGLVGIGETYLDVVLSQRIMHDLRVRIYSVLQHASLRFYTSQRTGEMISRLTNDVNGIEDIVKNTVSQTLSNLVKIVLVLGFMFTLNGEMTWISLAFIPFFLFLSRIVGKSFRITSTSHQELQAEISDQLEQTLSVSGALLIKSFGREQAETQRLGQMSQRLAGIKIGQTMRGRWLVLTLHLFFSALPAFFYFFGGLQITGGNGQLGQLVAFIALQSILFPACRSLLDINITLQTSLAVFERLFEYLDVPADIDEGIEARTLSELQGRVRFRHVAFAYNLVQPVFKDIDFEIQPGQFVAVVGPSGAGKTTLAYLLFRFYDVVQGALEIDGQDVRSLSLATLSRHIGMVPQDIYLLHTTVRENILYGKSEASEAEMMQAAQAACIHERIMQLPQGYDTVVGPRGYLLSGGEKQRIAIARALLKNPRILILDEATSALDTHSERSIQKAISNLQQNRTVIAIAHRLSTVLTADLILVLDKGEIVERGTHPELLRLDGLYAHLYREQLDNTFTEED